AFPVPGSIRELRFGRATLSPEGVVELEYSLDDALRFVERIDLPIAQPLGSDAIREAEPLVNLLHWVAGISYFKAAIPPKISCAGPLPGADTAQLLRALYSEGLGEFAVENEIDLPRPDFPFRSEPRSAVGKALGNRLLLPVGGGKDSIVGLEVLRTAGASVTLFSVGTMGPIRRTAEVAELPWLHASRQIDPLLLTYNSHGALNGHIPVTAIVSAISCLVAVLHNASAVVMSNERSASQGNVQAFGIDVNHQFSKSLRAERLFIAALAAATPDLAYYSILRGVSELAIARAFARLPAYHKAFTSCNAVFRLDQSRRYLSWCGECPKCRFVFLVLAPFMTPGQLTAIFDGRNLLEDPRQYEGFALLAAVGGDKPFECVGEEQEAIAAFRLLAGNPAWQEAPVVRRFTRCVLPQLSSDLNLPDRILQWSDDHEIPPELVSHARSLLDA
ncbi:MAG: endonuclease domain-containing protein, partial [Candidatus Dormibacteraceae bacterium]